MDGDEPPFYEDLVRFLLARSQALEESQDASNSRASLKIRESASLRRTSSAAAVAVSVSGCAVCKAKHYLSSCPTFASWSPNRRRDFVSKSKRCFNCLNGNHSIQNCQSKYTCRMCQGRHHTMLHVDKGSNSETSSSSVSPSASVSLAISAASPNEIASLSAQATPRQLTRVLLATSWVTISVPSGRSIRVRALLDQGSEMSFVTENLVQLLRARRVRMPVAVSGVGCVKAGVAHHATSVMISPFDAMTPSFPTTALILRSLTAYPPKRTETLPVSNLFRDLSWADPDHMSPAPIDIIIGADVYGELLLEGVRRAASGRLIAQNTALGWILSGPLPSADADQAVSRSVRTDEHIAHVHTFHSFESTSLDKEIRRFWEAEEVSFPTPLSPSDERCERHFRTTHSRDADGRYVVRIPFREGPPIPIGRSRDLAERLLHSLHRRLALRPAQRDAYLQFMRDYETQGHMRVVRATTKLTIR